MPRHIPYDMLIELQRGVTTHCLLLRIDPTQPGFEPLFATSLDRDVTYNDGAGAKTYLAPIGFQPSTQTSSSDLSVSGGEFSGMLPLYDFPVTEAALVSGAYDFASFTAYMVNYEKTTTGRHVVLQHGTTGRNTITDGGLAFMSELRGLAQNLKQSLTEKWSLGCRATFGSLPRGRLERIHGVVASKYGSVLTAIGGHSPQCRTDYSQQISTLSKSVGKPLIPAFPQAALSGFFVHA